MNAVERTALAQGVELYEEMTAVMDERTMEILDRRRKTAVIKRRGWLVRRLLLVADLIGLLGAFLIAQAIWGFNAPSVGRVDLVTETLIFIATLPGWILVVKLYGLYDRDEERTDHSTVDDLVGVFHMVTVGTWLFYAGAHVTHIANPDVTKIATFWGVATIVVTLSRAGARALARRRLTYLQNTVIVGAGDVGQLIARKLLNHPEYGINLVGFVDAEPKERRDDVGTLTLLGSPDRLPGIVRLFDVERVIFAFSRDSHEQTIDLIRSIKDLDIQIDIVPRLFELVGKGVEIHTVEGLPLFGLPPLHLSRSSRLLKRSMDVAVAVAGLLLLAPVFAAVALLIKRDSPGPVFFRQIRMGAGDKLFRIFKFRTMVEDADVHKDEFAHLNKHERNGGDARMFKIDDDPRVTRVGRFLRRYSIDELPQLLNVLKGEMSLVGPRPLILDEHQYVRDWAHKRLHLRPGMTGLWQVLGRSDIPFSEMIQLDYKYVTNWSLWNDLSLLLRTIPVVLRHTE
jgi:exopolysaccharide biosynthesis polyprenyl glycosylphosphotransferase